jgi:hypothetical protein
VTAEDAEKFDRIRRNVQYGCTIKELFWLCRLVEKLDAKPASGIRPQPPGADIDPRPKPRRVGAR